MSLSSSLKTFCKCLKSTQFLSKIHHTSSLIKMQQLIVFLIFSILALGSSSQSITCQYLNNDCPAGESCSALPVCGGLCLTTQPGITTTCTLGGTCPANAGGGECSSAIPTCTTSGCFGVCSQTPCTVGGTVCPSPQATCTPTEPCSGLCVARTTSPTIHTSHCMTLPFR